MDKNTLRINMTERERLRQQYLEGVPNDVYDTLWALEVMQERVSYWEYASRIAAELAPGDRLEAEQRMINICEEADADDDLDPRDYF